MTPMPVPVNGGVSPVPGHRLDHVAVDVTDGRSARAARTREAIVSALVELILDGEIGPTAPQVAERAGVSLRSVYGHFASVDDLHRAAAEKVALMVLERLRPIDPDDALDDKVASLGAQRSRICEDLGPLLLAAERMERSSPELAASRQRGRAASRAQLVRIFARELEVFGPAVRSRRIAAIDVLIDVHSWMQLRQRDAMSPTQARLTIVESVKALLAPPPPPAGDL